MTARRAFRSKAETLDAVAAKLKSARVLPLVHFTVADWREDRARVVARIEASEWSRASLIVRSSALAEDGAAASLAGRFLSILAVNGRDAVCRAVESVIASYGEDCSGEDRVLVQPQLTQARMSGVAFSQDPNTGSPYVVVNYAWGGDTAAVTGGRGDGLQTAYFWKDAPQLPPSPLDGVVALVRELEALFSGTALDVEFAQDKDDVLFLFQVRPLAMPGKTGLARPAVTALLAGVAAKIDSANRPHPYLHGRRTVYGVMPDWNPAEIVGIRPRPLALSLYREIVTDSIWAYQRHNYGYQNLRSFPLLVEFCGLPYIDVRVSFNSFVPADVPAELANRLVDYYVDRLIEAPALHDKVEFEIVLSCYSFDLDRRLAGLRRHGFTTEDCELLKAGLNKLTNRIIHRDTGLWRRDSERIEELVRRHAMISASDLDPVSRIYWLLEDCKRYGTLPFAGLARAGFIAVQMLASLVGTGVLSEADRASFMAGLDTINSRMGRDFSALERGEFLNIYGHLRPGTYDILSPRYDEAPDRYFDWSRRHIAKKESRPAGVALTLSQMRSIERLLKEHNLEHDVVGLFGFLEAGIRGREHSKFVFTRSLSDALRMIGRLGTEHGFTLDDLSYLDIRTIYELYAGSDDVRAALGESIARGRRAHARSRAIALPPLITSGADVWRFEMPPSEPNFITQGRVTGQAARVDSGTDLAGRIAMITNGDPGYDWIFSRGIAGFITAYGGVNSHMAIRATELRLPAVIGAGEIAFDRWCAAEVLEIDAASRQVRIIR